MVYNTKLVQINGPFNSGQELYNALQQKISELGFTYIYRIGICSKPHHYVTLNDILFEIGSTGMLEFDDVQITSVRFNQAEDFFTIVDCIVV